MGASEAHKLELLGLLANQGWAGNEDEGLMETIWSSFDDPAAVADQNMPLWRLCVARGADLQELRAVRAARTQFEQDVKALVHHHLAANRRYVGQEMERLGIAETGQPQPALGEEQRAEVEELQRLAAEVSRAQQVRDDLQHLTVGYDLTPEARPGLVGSATTTPQHTLTTSSRGGDAECSDRRPSTRSDRHTTRRSETSSPRWRPTHGSRSTTTKWRATSPGSRPARRQCTP